jgi:hypothetical protein
MNVNNDLRIIGAGLRKRTSLVKAHPSSHNSLRSWVINKLSLAIVTTKLENLNIKMKELNQMTELAIARGQFQPKLIIFFFVSMI